MVGPGQRQSLKFLKRRCFHRIHTAGSYKIYQGLTLWRGAKLRKAIYLRVSEIQKPKAGVFQGHHPHGTVVTYKKHKKNRNIPDSDAQIETFRIILKNKLAPQEMVCFFFNTAKILLALAFIKVMRWEMG